jgi:hypothetical protein
MSLEHVSTPHNDSLRVSARKFAPTTTRNRSRNCEARVEAEGGKIKRTGDKDRKRFVLERIRHYLLTGQAGEPTIYRKSVVRSEKLQKLSPAERLHYGQYDKKTRLNGDIKVRTSTQFLTNFNTFRSPMEPPQMTPLLSTEMPSGKLASPLGRGSGMKAVTTPSLTLPI